MASYLQSYFQSSSMPKRLLKYALSRLEILDTDALDLENLDIAWGKNSTFEFRDVGLRLQKLEALLQLPSSLEVCKAKVLLLRLTLPVDIHSSPILVEVDGVESQVRVKPKGTTSTTPRTNHDRRTKRRPRPRSPDIGRPSQKWKDGLDTAEDGDLETAIPTAADLAESFLQTEPETEKAELEAALLNRTEELEASSVLSEDGEGPVGTGASLSLPAFMTRFLQGIVDRLQVRIHGITINLDVDIPNESAGPQVPTSQDSVTIQLKVENIDIEGVTHQLNTDVKADENEGSRPPTKEGSRLIYLSQIRGVLISEANFFSNLARSSALSSPSAAQSDVFPNRSVSSKASPSIRSSMIRQASTDVSPSPGSPVVSSRHSSSSLPRRADLSLLSNSAVVSDNGRFDDASEDGETSQVLGGEHLAMSEVGDSIYGNSAYLEQMTDSEYMEENELGLRSYLNPAIRAISAEDTSPLSTPRASAHLPSSPEKDFFSSRPIERPERHERPIPQSMLQSTILPTRPLSRFSEGRVSQSQPALPVGSLSSLPRHQSFTRHPEETSEIIEEEAIHSDGEDEMSTPVGEHDLAQSQLFSHEDAESMYMSALSHDSSSGIPGGWAHSSLGSDGSRSLSGSPSQSPPVEPLDNLERARISIPESVPTDTTPDSSVSPTVSISSKQLPPSSSFIAQSQQLPVLPQAASDISERSTASDEYTRLSKRFFDLDSVAIYIPALTTEDSSDLLEDPYFPSSASVAGSTFDGQSETPKSTSLNIPGAFSTHLPSPRTPVIPFTPVAEYPPPRPSTKLPEERENAIEIALGKLLLQFDISVGRLVFKLVQQLKDALSQDSPKPTSTTTAKTDSPTPEQRFLFGAEDISVKFLDRLEGTLYSSNAAPYSGGPSGDVLLQTTLRGLKIDSQTANSLTKTTLTLKKFTFGYAHESIISFDSAFHMREMRGSIRDLRASDGIDVLVEMTKTTDTTRLNIVTLPIHVSIDLQRLDETFSWFGGLSSVLNMGSSIASNATITAASPSKAKPKGVRFDAPIRPDDKSVASQNKADIRIGGFVLDLVGAECSVGVETSAVKMVNRDEGIGVFIQKIKLSGPHVKHSHEDPAITVEISSTRIEYLEAPKDVDLGRLLALITPSKDKYDHDDDILLDTLLRQRRQGAVIRVTVEGFSSRVGRMHELSYLPELGEEIARLSTVAKYLPDDDRPGLLALVMIHKFDAYVDFDNDIGSLQISSTEIEVAQITLPALVALSVGTLTARRNTTEELLGAASNPELREPKDRAPAIMARMIGDEMEPTIKIKLWNLRVEYRVPTLMALLGLAQNATGEDLSASIVASVATLRDYARSNTKGKLPQAKTSSPTPRDTNSKGLTIDVVVKDCILGANPLGLPSKLLLVLTDAHVITVLPKDGKANASVDVGKAALLIIDNVANISSGSAVKSHRQSFDGGSTQVADLCAIGYVSVGYISSATAIALMNTSEEGDTSIDVELRNNLFVLESCADSTQTLIGILGGLSPPTPPSTEVKYRTKVIPVHDLLASLSGDAFGTAEGEYNFEDDFEFEGSADESLDQDADDLELDSHYIQAGAGGHTETLFDYDEGGSSASTHVTTRDTHDGVLLDSFIGPSEPIGNTEELDFQEDHFGTGSILEGTAHRWNSSKNTYDRSNASRVKKSPLKVCVRDVHIIWNLFDGYDWQHTRDVITKVVQDVESKAIEKRARNERRPQFDMDVDDEETVIGDFLFNSIYIGIPANRDPRELAAAINQELNDNATETESIAATSVSSSPSRPGGSRRAKPKKLRLNRSKHHKITFELTGVSVDLVTFPLGSGETQSSIDVRVHTFEIFDHVPTSTWRKFATYMQDAGERETGSSMIHIEILNVKPVPELAASEIVLKATVLPLRLHVDQDALDFITRFFEFKDDSAPDKESKGEEPFLQRVEVNAVQVKLDFKPKRVDYAGLRSGHTTEFMNFLILDEADMTLRHTIIYGISGFEKLGQCLNDIWMPDIKRNQLPGILAGLAPVRSLVNVGGGFRHLVVVPMREYKKDGRIVRGISKGAAAFARTTGTELVKLGAKVAIGVQTVLQGAEGLLSPLPSSSSLDPTEEEDEETKQISLYANQPVGVLQGLRGGYEGLQRDLVLARDAIIAVPGEVMEEGNAMGVVRAVRRYGPTFILRPAIGVARGAGQVLLGVTNELDKGNLRRAEAKYKKH